MRVAVLSGAGISAESGVPTFRDDKNGLWARFDPYELSSTQGWLRNPERVWGWYLWRHYLVANVEPNDGHRAIAAWQDHAEVSVITQNVDDLHGAPAAVRCITCTAAFSNFVVHVVVCPTPTPFRRCPSLRSKWSRRSATAAV